MATIKLPKEVLLDYLEQDGDKEVVLINKITDTSRWSEIYDFVFKHEGKIYRCGYSCGATEQQDEGPWEYETEVGCVEVEEYIKEIKAYRAITS